MCLLHLIKKHHAVRFAAHRFCELAAFIIAHIAGRRSDQTGHRVLFHILAHVDADHIGFIVKQRFRQCLGKLRLSHTGGAQKQEGADGLGGILYAGLRADNGLRHLFHALVLAHHPFVEHIIQMQGLAALALRQFCHGNSRPLGYNPGNFILSNALMNQAQILAPYLGLLGFQLLLQLRKSAVLQLRRLIQIILLLGVLNLPVHIFNFLPQAGKPVYAGLLVLPLGLAGGKLIMKLCQLFLKIRQPILAQAVRLLFERRLLNFHLHNLPAHLVQLGGQGIQLCLNHSAGLIHQVNRLIRQEPVGDIAV